MTHEAITSGQKKQFLRFVEDAAQKALQDVDLDKNELQLVIEHGNKLQIAIVSTIEKLVTAAYPGEYHIKHITQQISTLRRLFPGIGSANVNIAYYPIPKGSKGAEGWFAVPRWDKISPSYNNAVEKVLELIENQRDGGLDNVFKDRMGPPYLRKHSHTVSKLQKLAEEQDGYDILIIPAQFGLLHRGLKIDQDRKVFTDNEFGLGAFEVGCMLLTHPKRLVTYRNLWIDCPGDEMARGADGDFSDVPCFTVEHDSNRIRFWPGVISMTNMYFGSATGFLP